MSGLVVLSPHFDDSVLSCGGRLWQAGQGGGAARVLVLFAGPPAGEPPPFAQVQHRMWGDPPDANRLRRAEDAAAHARLGCFDLHHLPTPDAVYRVAADGCPLYGSEAAIFGPIQPEESDFAATLTDLARPLLLPGALVLAPLGVGRHVDHQLAHGVGRALLQEGWRVAFYEELPYVEWPDALEAALADKAGWQRETLPLSDAAIAAKIAAMRYYGSQTPVLYGDDATMEQRIRAAASTTAGGIGYAECLWYS